jgi:hypothetical protein
VASDFSIRISGLPEFNAALTRIERQIDVATVAALKSTQNLAKKTIRAQMRGRPRWDHRGKSSRTGGSVSLHLNPPHVSKGGGPGKLTGTLTRGVGGVRKPKKTPEGFAGGVGVGGGVRNLYKKRIEGTYPYVKPGLAKATAGMPAIWEKAWDRSVRL